MLRCTLKPRAYHLISLRSFSRWLPQSSSSTSNHDPPKSGTQKHNDLPSFLNYANRTGLSTTSTTYVGTYYEYMVQCALRHLGFSLTRVGGRDDSGIDLVGTWHLPSNTHPLRVLVQCKALKGKLGPNLVRELEGAFIGAPLGWRGENVLGFLVSPKSATKGVREAMRRSRWAMGWIMVENEDGEGRVKQVLWNRAAVNIGLEGITATVRYTEKNGCQDGALDNQCVLLWKGRPIEGQSVVEGSVKTDGQCTKS